MEFSLAFLAGVVGVLTFPVLPASWFAVLVLCLAICGFGLRERISGALVLCGLASGALMAWVHAFQYLALRWPPSPAEDRVIARVVVDTLPVNRGGSWSFDGLATVERPAPTSMVLRVRLVWPEAPVQPRVGEQWRLLLTLRPPRAHVNGGAPDVERMLFHDRVHALGSVINTSINQRIDAGHRPLDALRQRIAEHIDAEVTDRDAAALIAALAVGATGEMSREQWRVFNATGTTHLVAISGLHVTLFALVAIAVSRVLWNTGLYRIVRWTREPFAAAIGFMGAAAYAVLSGLSVPTQRTLIMLGAWLLTRSLARAAAPFHTFALALVAVLMLDPFAPLAPGFWLSFGAMAAIIVVDSASIARPSFIAEAITVQLAVTVALVPFTLAAFGSISIVGPLVNAVAIPAMSWILVPTILLSVVLEAIAPTASNGALAVAQWIHEICWPWLAAAADLPWTLVHANPPWWWYALAVPSVFVSLMPLPWTLRTAVLAAVMPLAMAVSDPVPDGAVDITVLDVGEGTAVLVETPRHVLVFDTGDVYGSDGRAVDNVLLPVLRSRGIHHIDVLVLSALTPVTAPGVAALFAEFPVVRVLVGGQGVLAGWPAARPCSSAPHWEWNGVRFRVLHTKACVLLIESAGSRALLPGDADGSVIEALRAEGPHSTDLVLVPRNGRDASNSAEFIRTVAGHWAVVAGRLTRAGHGKPAVARWQEQGASVLATYDLGAVRMRFSASGGMQVPRSARTENRTLWRGSP